MLQMKQLVGFYFRTGSQCVLRHILLIQRKETYTQIEKECLAIVTCMSKWHQYLYGKKNILVHTDHQPLETIFRKPLSKAPRRFQLMTLKLQQYHFSVQYKKGKEMYIANTLSRAALTNPTATGTSEEEVFRVELSSMDLKPPNLSNVTLERLKEEVSSNATLKSLYETVLKGWPLDRALLTADLRPDNGVLLKSHQVIILPSMRQEMLNKIHKAHQGADSSIRSLRNTLLARYVSGNMPNLLVMWSMCTV